MLLQIFIPILLLQVQTVNAEAVQYDVCQQTPSSNMQCSKQLKIYFYDKETNTCQSSVMCPPESYGNAFASRESCQSRCVQNEADESQEIPGQSGEDRDTDIKEENVQLADVVASRILHHSFSCSNPKDTGHSCAVSPSTNYWYNPSTGICEQFTFKGCGGNSNNFVSYTACTDRCDTETSNVCKMLKDRGSCRAHKSMFYFNKYKGQCEPFSYSGCGGNLNRFSTALECQAECGGPLYEKPIAPQPVYPPPVYPPPVRRGFLNFIFSIDFSGSTTSMHNSNQFSTAIQALGDIIQKYDADNHFPALGFGHGSLGDAFHLNQNGIQGIHGVMSAYRAIKMNGGGSKYAPSIKKATEMARQDPHHHTVLLLLSDGDPSGINEVIDAIITASSEVAWWASSADSWLLTKYAKKVLPREASKSTCFTTSFACPAPAEAAAKATSAVRCLMNNMTYTILASEVPMSIVLIGVNSGSHTSDMKHLDSDGKLLSRNGRTARQDVVQFVDITQHYSNRYNLEREVFAEVPQYHGRGPYWPNGPYPPYNGYGP